MMGHMTLVATCGSGAFSEGRTGSTAAHKGEGRVDMAA